MKAKTIWIVAGAVLLGGSVVAASRGKSMHERCKAGHACGPAGCKK